MYCHWIKFVCIDLSYCLPPMCFGGYFMFVVILIIPAILVDELCKVYDLPVRVISRFFNFFF